MEKDPICKTHSKSVQIFCKDCNELTCSKCFTEHKEKGCTNIIPLLTYGQEELLPIYKERINGFKRLP